MIQDPNDIYTRYTNPPPPATTVTVAGGSCFAGNETPQPQNSYRLTCNYDIIWSLRNPTGPTSPMRHPKRPPPPATMEGWLWWFRSAGKWLSPFNSPEKSSRTQITTGKAERKESIYKHGYGSSILHKTERKEGWTPAGKTPSRSPENCPSSREAKRLLTAVREKKRSSWGGSSSSKRPTGDVTWGTYRKTGGKRCWSPEDSNTGTIKTAEGGWRVAGNLEKGG